MATLDQVVDVIRHYNHPFLNLIKGAQVHSLSDVTVHDVGSMIMSQANQLGLPLPYILACIAQESGFDPQCYNKNQPHHNPSGSFEGTDWGICQFSGRYLHSKPGMAGLTQDQQRDKALDYTWAIPVFVSNMNGLLKWAQETLDRYPIYIPTAKNKYFLATLAYNAGQTEAINEVISTQVRAHPLHVEHLCVAIAKMLGEPDPMATS